MVEVDSTARLQPEGPHATGAATAFLVRIGRSHLPRRPAPLLIPLDQVRDLTWGRAAGGDDALAGEGSARPQLALADPSLSGRHCRLLRLPGAQRYALEDLGSTNGCHVNGVRVEQAVELAHGDLIETGQTFFCLWHAPVPTLEALLPRSYRGGPITPRSSVCFAMLEVLHQIERVAPSELPVIVHGESGTGKELLAAELHRQSGRAGPLVALNCAAIPEGLIESELFGHCKGAFTGAVADKRGLIESATDGTLLLDEIGDMPLAAQAKLLRVLQERVFVRVGDTRPRRIDVRFVAATHRDLPQLVADERFRGDLYARLNGLTVALPPLRARRQDLGLLLAAFLDELLGDDQRVVVSHDLFRALALHDWPYNIRELRQAVAAAVTLGRDTGTLRPSHLPAAVRAALEPGRSATAHPATPAQPRAAGPRGRRFPSDDELRRALLQALQQQAGNVSAVARSLQTSRMQVHRWMKRLGIDPDQHR